MLRLQGENDDLAQELVGSKVKLRVEMDKVSRHSQPATNAGTVYSWRSG